MALFTDGTISTLDDLTAHDSAVLEVASTEGIDVTRKLSLAREELGLELGTLLSRVRGYDEPGAAGSAELTCIAVTPPLKLWHTYRTLELVYRDAYGSQLNDRYRGKRDEYRELAKWASEKLAQAGIGIVRDPVPQADEPILTLTPGVLADGTYYASICWVNSKGEAGAAGPPQAISVTAGTGFRVQPPPMPAGVTGWNLYVGPSPDSLRQQNSTAIKAGQSWLQSTMPGTEGRVPGNGQAPQYLRATPRILQRG